MDFSGIRYGAQIAAAAARHDVDPRLLAAIAAQETGGPGSNSGNNVVGDGGHGRGVFQIDDRSWAFARTPAAMDPAQNADMAATILHDNLQRYGGNARMAVSAYNSGSPTAPGTLTTWNDGQTLSYADSVFRHYAQLGGDPQAQLLADNRENASDVNALAVLRRKQSPPAFSAGPYLAAGNAAATLPPAMPFAPSAPAPSSNGPSRTVADSAGTQADHLYASLVDLGDGFDNPSDDDT